MPFDPKLIHPDDAPLKPDGELDLPDDLAALGEQLRDDAAHLAACYPAEGRQVGGQTQVAAVARSRSRRWMRVGLLTTSSLASVLVIAVALQHFSKTRQVPPSIEATSTDGQPAHAISQSNTVNPVTDLRPAPTTISLTDLSGPELEALLDLWQRDPQPPESTAIAF